MACGALFNCPEITPPIPSTDSDRQKGWPWLMWLIVQYGQTVQIGQFTNSIRKVEPVILHQKTGWRYHAHHNQSNDKLFFGLTEKKAIFRYGNGQQAW